MSPTEHRIRTTIDPDNGRAYWECDCGHGGSTPTEFDVGEASDKHIPFGDHRIDVYGGDDW